MKENKYSQVKEKTKTALIVLASFVLLLVLALLFFWLIDSISKNQIVDDPSFGSSPQQVLKQLTAPIVDLPDLDLEPAEKEKINLERQKIIDSLTP